MNDLFNIEVYEYDEENERYDWYNYSQTPIFEQAAAILRNMAERQQKARTYIYLDDGEKHYFFNYEIKRTPEGVTINYLTGKEV